MKQQSLKIFSKEETGPYELPKGWRWVRLGEVLKEDRKTINPQDYPAENFWLVTMDCVESNTGKLLKKINLCGKEIKSTKYQFNFNHVLYGKLRPYLNKVYAVPEGERGICTTEFIPFIPLNADKKYIAFYLRKKEVIEFAMNNLTGTRQPRVNIEALLSFQIPLPSLPEQKRIVARIEALFSKIDEIKRLRKEANDLAKTLLQSALHEVFSKADEKGWKWVRLGEIVKKDKFSIVDGPFGTQLHTSDYVSSGVPLIRIKNFKYNFEFDESDLKFISEEKFEELKRSAVFPGDIILAKTGATIGKVCIFPSKFEKGLITSSCAKISVDRNIVDNKFVIFALATEKVQKQILILSSGSTRPSLTLSQVADLEIPLPFKNGQPALDEQKRIVSYLDQISEKQKILLKIYENIDNQITELKQSILNKAFRGGLLR